ncbi:hypothetical protein SISNIDRAFT_459079 [Sistotremastrum niveocremeum HHB9708]|uniref:Uncharacterized protein n=1 Tax=Sistotremastrum niveocremeum HHB9708 TaxID=1314777 RepID=A0A164PWR2_9AGAM|nr:hypothetical protein SISNIDRAFT_459079 [Sistotremastrum niveocremeum HHB9708]
MLDRNATPQPHASPFHISDSHERLRDTKQAVKNPRVTHSNDVLPVPSVNPASSMIDGF